MFYPAPGRLVCLCPVPGLLRNMVWAMRASGRGAQEGERLAEGGGRGREREHIKIRSKPQKGQAGATCVRA